MEFEPIHVTVPGSPNDPRREVEEIEGVIIHRSPSLHPDDVSVVDGIPCTSPARTLLDIAEVLDEEELRQCFVNAAAQGLLDPDQIRATRARVEWRPSLQMFDAVCAEFIGG